MDNAQSPTTLPKNASSLAAQLAVLESRGGREKGGSQTSTGTRESVSTKVGSRPSTATQGSSSPQNKIGSRPPSSGEVQDSLDSVKWEDLLATGAVESMRGKWERRASPPSSGRVQGGLDNVKWEDLLSIGAVESVRGKWESRASPPSTGGVLGSEKWNDLLPTGAVESMRGKWESRASPGTADSGGSREHEGSTSSTSIGKCESRILPGRLDNAGSREKEESRPSTGTENWESRASTGTADSMGSREKEESRSSTRIGKWESSASLGTSDIVGSREKEESSPSTGTVESIRRGKWGSQPSTCTLESGPLADTTGTVAKGTVSMTFMEMEGRDKGGDNEAKQKAASQPSTTATTNFMGWEKEQSRPSTATMESMGGDREQSWTSTSATTEVMGWEQEQSRPSTATSESPPYDSCTLKSGDSSPATPDNGGESDSPLYVPKKELGVTLELVNSMELAESLGLINAGDTVNDSAKGALIDDDVILISPVAGEILHNKVADAVEAIEAKLAIEKKVPRGRNLVAAMVSK